MSDESIGIVLAGGLSRRMGGGDKGMIPIDRMPLIARVINRLTTQVDHVAINANGDPNRFAAYGLPIVPDTVAGFAGPLAGILSGLKYASKIGAHGIITVAADTPFFPSDLVAQLKGCSQDEQKIVLATSNGNRHPTFGYWPVTHTDDLAEWLSDVNNRKVLAWVHRHDWAMCDFPLFESGDDPFFNINTPEDVTEAEKVLAAIRAQTDKAKTS